MNIKQALAFADNKLSEGHKSDGCTFAPEFGLTKWCVMHDMLRRFCPVSPAEADKLFLEGMKTEGLRYYPIAYLYYSFSVLARKIGIYK